MTSYAVKKRKLTDKQSTDLSNGDYAGVVDGFANLDKHIDIYCPSELVASEKQKLSDKQYDWNKQFPEFRLTNTIDDNYVKTELNIDPGKQCTKIGEFYYHIEISTEQKQCLGVKIPLIRNNGLINASDGVYTWLIFTDKKDNRQVVAKKALTAQEISTKHLDILYDIYDEGGTINYAGEFMKTGNEISINFLSGTFMQDQIEIFMNEWKESLGDDDLTSFEEAEMVDRLYQDALTFLEEAFGGYLTFTFEKGTKTFITTPNIPYTRESIELFLRCGAIIRRFDNKTLCRLYENRVNNKINAATAHDIQIRIWQRFNSVGIKPVNQYMEPFEGDMVTVANIDENGFPSEYENPGKRQKVA